MDAVVLPADHGQHRKKLNFEICWGTEREIEFIKTLGEHRANTRFYEGPAPQISKAELLAGYLDGACRRTDWGDIDGMAVIAKARSLLKYHTGKESEEKNGISQ